jgi:hypothetical protein
MDIFQRALAHADAHEQPKVEPERALKPNRRQNKPVHHRAVSVLSASLAVLLLAGFFVYQNKAAITLRYADAKAGFHASLPGYHPGGFAVGKFNYSEGSISVHYAKPGTSKSYTINQQVSTIDSSTALASNIATEDNTYKSIQQGEHTLYIYGNGQAAWVNGGILYHINSDGNLDTSELINIAASV